MKTNEKRVLSIDGFEGDFNELHRQLFDIYPDIIVINKLEIPPIIVKRVNDYIIRFYDKPITIIIAENYNYKPI